LFSSVELKRKDYFIENHEVIIQYRGKDGKYRRKSVHPRLEEILNNYLILDER